jgi:hypothetical protein
MMRRTNVFGSIMELRERAVFVPQNYSASTQTERPENTTKKREGSSSADGNILRESIAKARPISARASLYGTLIFWSLSIALGRHAHADSLILEGTGDVRRVENFYTTVQEAEPSVCRPILLSLNKEYRLSDEKLDNNPRVSLTSDSLLESVLQVPWTRKLVQQSDAQSYHVTSLDVAQVSYEGRTISLFRRGLENFSVETGALATNKLWVDTAPMLSLPSDRDLTMADAARIPGVEVSVDMSNVPRIDKHRNVATSKAPAEPMLLNVVSIKDNLYLLVIDAIQAEIAAPRSSEGTIDLFVFRFLSSNDLRAVCHLRST